MSDLSSIVRCPLCHGDLAFEEAAYRCPVHGPFLTAEGQSVLVDFDSSVLVRDAFVARGGATPIARRRLNLVRLLKGKNKGAERAAARLRKDLPAGARVLVVGGAVAGSGADALYDGGLELVSVDIYPSSLTCLVADAHKLPFKDESFDAVWIQAVLEHVLEPAEVVAEIHRVLKDDGLVFADTPFLQPVHEAAYDFTRFTRSGHRWLFRRFEEIEAGTTGGAGTSLLWSIRYFVRATTGSRRLGSIVGLALFWLRFFDRDTVQHRDAASGFHFLGRKCDVTVHPNEMPAYYG